MGTKRRIGDDERSNVHHASKRARRVGVKENKKTDFDYITKHDYVTVGDVMYVRPYVFEYKCFFKPRWKDRYIFDAFVDEFPHVDTGYWQAEFRNSRVLCNGKAIGEDVLWEEGKQVVHIVHRHESAVIFHDIEICADEEGYVVVSKPASMPVHPCGTYRRNSLQFVLRAFYGYEQLLCVHRLDKETSGLVILAKDTKHASMFSKVIQEHRVTKTYLAEVHGMFPTSVTECLAHIYWNKRSMRSSVPDTSGGDGGGSGGQEAKTSFRVIGRNGKRQTTVVECTPLTGRTHQIRVHLTHLGYPIVNDPLYGISALGQQKNNNDANSSKLEALISMNNPTPQFTQKNISAVRLNQSEFREDGLNNEIRPSNGVCEWSQRMQEEHGGRLTSAEEGKLLECGNCPQVSNVKNVECKTMYIHLHALKYKSEDWSFQVSPPIWMKQEGFVQGEQANQLEQNPDIGEKRSRCTIS